MNALCVGDITQMVLFSGIAHPAIVTRVIDSRYCVAMGIVPGRYLGYTWIIKRGAK